MADILLTGPARSGTTLICACLNQLTDCLALAEPMAPPTHGSAADALRYISTFLLDARHRALSEKKATTKMADEGFDTTNWFGRPSPTGTLRSTREFVGELTVRKPLSPRFKLIVKHPAFFTALAAPLQETYPLYAIVRDPLATLASWQTVDMPINRGRWPAAEAFSPVLRERLAKLEGTLERQVAILRWCFQTYERLPRNRVFRLEDLTTNPGTTLSDFHSGADPITVSMQIEDPALRYAGVNLPRLARELRSYTADFEWIYPKFDDSLAGLMGG